MTTKTYQDDQGFECFEHTNTQGDRAVVKSKGNCLEITPGSDCCLQCNTDDHGRVIYVWMVKQ